MGLKEHLEVSTNGILDLLVLGSHGQTVPNSGNTSWGKPLSVALDKANTAGSAWWERWVVAKAWDLDVVAVAEFQDSLVLESLELTAIDGH